MVYVYYIVQRTHINIKMITQLTCWLTHGGFQWQHTCYQLVLYALSIMTSYANAQPTFRAYIFTSRAHYASVILTVSVTSVSVYNRHLINVQGCSPRGICLGSRRPRCCFFSWLSLTRSCLSLDLTASASALPHSFCLGLSSAWKVAPRLGSVVISQLKRASAHGAQVQV